MQLIENTYELEDSGLHARPLLFNNRAEILVVNDLTRVQYPGKTNDEGIYLVSNLPPGLYPFQVSKFGLKTF
jgi:hypothetical protein